MELNDAVIVDDDGNTYEESPLSNFRSEEEFNEQFKENIQDPDDMEGHAEGDPTEYKQNMLTQLKNYANQYGINPIKQGLNMGIGAVSGIPGASLLMNAFSRPNYPSDTMSKSFAYGNQNAGKDHGYYGDLRHGNLTGQDQFGINTISMMGNYPAYYDQYARDYRAGKYSPTSKFATNKYAHAQAVNKANQERIARDFANTDAEDEINVTAVHGPHKYHQNDGGGNQNIGSTQHGSSGMTKDQHAAFRMARGGITGLWPR